MTVQVTRVLFFSRQYEAAINASRKALELDPNFGGAHLFLGRIYAHQRLDREAIAELQTARALLDDSAEVLAVLGYAHAAAGREADARKIVGEMDALSKRRYVSPYHLAMVAAGLGERDRALDLLEKAYEDREGRMTILRVAPEFDVLHADPRFARLIEKMRLM
jgi:tetratricopeptide (TPR) repeat protein